MSLIPETVDSETGLSTRFRFDLLFDFAISIADRGIPLTLGMLAPDGIERYAEENGTESADQAVIEFGRRLQSATRKGDVIARYGGDEFVCLFVDCNASGGMVVADRLRAEMYDLTTRTGLTMSAGVATYGEGMESAEDFKAAARGALAAAQAAGGDRTGLPDD